MQTLNAKVYSDNQWQELLFEANDAQEPSDAKSSPLKTTLFNLTCFKSVANQINQSDLLSFLKENRVGDSPDYAVVKNGNDVLMIVTGMLDDKRACEDIAKPYNEDPSLSTLPGTFECVKVND